MLRFETWLVATAMLVPSLGQVLRGDIDVHTLATRAAMCFAFAWVVVAVLTGVIERITAVSKAAEDAADEAIDELVDERENSLWEPPTPTR